MNNTSPTSLAPAETQTIFGGSTTLMSDDDKEAIAYAARHGFLFPRYRANRIAHDGEPFVTEEYFTPVQFRAITLAPFPECCTYSKCKKLIEIWNRASAGRGSYELIW